MARCDGATGSTAGGACRIDLMVRTGGDAMDGHDPHPDPGTVGVSIPREASTAPQGSTSDAGADYLVDDDPLLDLLERWYENYRCGEDVSPESLGVTDPALL